MNNFGKNLLWLSSVLCVTLSAHTWAANTIVASIEDQLASGNARQALSLVDKELSQHPQDAQLQFLRSRALLGLERHAEARQLLEQLSARDPRPEVLNNLGWLYASEGLYADAKTQLLAALKTDPRYDVIYTNLNNIYATLASEAYQKALGETVRGAAPKPNLQLISELRTLEPAPVAAATVNSSGTAEASAPSEPISNDPQAMQSVIASAQAWAKAWSARDGDNYLNFYGPDFVTPDRLSREQWNLSRKERLKASKFIEVGIEQPEVTLMEHGKMAILSFVQQYRSNTLREKTRKVLIMKNYEGQWRIVVEQAGV